MSADGCHPAVRQCSLRTPIAARKGSRADPPGNILCIVEQEDLEDLQISNVELAISPSGVIGLLARASSTGSYSIAASSHMAASCVLFGDRSDFDS